MEVAPGVGGSGGDGADARARGPLPARDDRGGARDRAGLTRRSVKTPSPGSARIRGPGCRTLLRVRRYAFSAAFFSEGASFRSAPTAAPAAAPATAKREPTAVTPSTIPKTMRARAREAGGDRGAEDAAGEEDARVAAVEERREERDREEGGETDAGTDERWELRVRVRHDLFSFFGCRGRPSGHPSPPFCMQRCQLVSPWLRGLALASASENPDGRRPGPTAGRRGTCATLPRRERVQVPPRLGRRLPVLEVRGPGEARPEREPGGLPAGAQGARARADRGPLLEPLPRAARRGRARRRGAARGLAGGGRRPLAGLEPARPRARRGGRLGHRHRARLPLLQGGGDGVRHPVPRRAARRRVRAAGRRAARRARRLAGRPLRPEPARPDRPPLRRGRPRARSPRGRGSATRSSSSTRPTTPSPGPTRGRSRARTRTSRCCAPSRSRGASGASAPATCSARRGWRR